MMKNLVFWLLVMIANIPLYANPIDFKHFDIGDKLSNDDVNAIQKDSHGFMWFGMSSGLQRYDGYAMRTFRHIEGDSLSLPDNYVYEFIPVNNDEMWLNTGAGYAIFNLNTYKFDNHIDRYMKHLGSDGLPQKVVTDRRHRLWLFVPGEGIYCYQPERDYCRFFDPTKYELPVYGIVDMDEVEEYMLVMYNDGRIVSLDPDLLDVENVAQTPHLNPSLDTDNYTYQMFVDRKGGVWVYNFDELTYYDPELMTFDSRRGEYFLQHKIWIHTLAEDKNGNLWVGTDNHGIFLLNRRSGEVTEVMPSEDNDRSLLFPTIMTLYSDDTDLMWVGMYKKGLAWYGESIYKFTLNKMGDVNIVTPGRNHKVWMGQSGKGIIEWDPKTNEQRLFTYPKYEGDNIIVSILQASDGSVWAGTYRDGLIRLHNGQVTAFRTDTPGSTVNDNNIWALAEDKQGHIWAATLNRGLNCYDPRTGRFEVYNKANSGLAMNSLASICPWGDKHLLVGTASAGVDLFSLETHTAKNIEALSKYHINHLCCDARNILWVGAREGLVAYDLTSNRLLKTPSILDPISAVIEDDEHNMWVTMGTRIFRIHPSRTEDGSYTFASEVYDKSDGLQYSDFNLRSICKLDDGTIVAGGILGLNIFNPKDMKFNSHAPKVMFTGFTLFNEEVTEGADAQGHNILPRSIASLSEISLSYNQNVFSISFGTDNYILPEKTVFSYKLEGFSSEWLTLPAGQNTVAFTNLTPGRYTLRVIARNNDGCDSKEEATLTLIVRPPFWRTLWAYVIYVLIVIAILFSAHLKSIRREREKYRLEQMRREAEKNEELNNSKMRFFSSISNELRNPISLIIAPLSAMIHDVKDEALRKRLQGVFLHAQVLLNTINQLLDFRAIEEKHHLSLSEGDIVDYVRGVCDDFILMAEEKNIQFSFFTEEKNILMAFDAEKIQKIVTNLLSNAFKYTPNGGKVNVMIGHLGEDKNMVEIKVSDSGIGISDEDKKHIFDRFYQKKNDEDNGVGIGLTLAYEFATLHGGTINVFDNIGRGSVFVVLIPQRQNQALQDIIATAREDEQRLNASDKPSAEGEKPAEEGKPAAEDEAAKTAGTAGPSAQTEEEKAEDARIEQQLEAEEAEQKKENEDTAPEGASTDTEEEDKEIITEANNSVAPVESVRLDRTRIRKPTGNAQVLVVDDNDDFLTFMKYNLARSYRVETATDGREAWEMLKTLTPDLIISDVMMPDMNGHELCRLIRKDEHLSHVPVLMLTARHTEDSKLEGLQVGADDYMTKPFNPHILALRMERLIELGKQRLRSRVQSNLSPTDLVITSMDEKLLQDAREYVEAHIGNSELSVEELSRKLGMSRVNLYKKLLQLSGKTPIEFIRIIRLKRAAQLLRESQMHVSEIAFEVGFNNPKYFAKYFKEEYGVLPSTYQEAHASKKRPIAEA
jgi:signal transduction histidine kinase/DNA-binding response OmpR family regulator/ligand-binding sensor domain-containing protein